MVLETFVLNPLKKGRKPVVVTRGRQRIKPWPRMQGSRALARRKTTNPAGHPKTRKGKALRSIQKAHGVWGAHKIWKDLKRRLGEFGAIDYAERRYGMARANPRVKGFMRKKARGRRRNIVSAARNPYVKPHRREGTRVKRYYRKPARRRNILARANVGTRAGALKAWRSRRALARRNPAIAAAVQRGAGRIFPSTAELTAAVYAGGGAVGAALVPQLLPPTWTKGWMKYLCEAATAGLLGAGTFMATKDKNMSSLVTIGGLAFALADLVNTEVLPAILKEKAPATEPVGDWLSFGRSRGVGRTGQFYQPAQDAGRFLRDPGGTTPVVGGTGRMGDYLTFGQEEEFPGGEAISVGDEGGYGF